MNLSPRLVIFDLDGTLVEFHHDYLFDQALRILDELGHPAVERTVLENAFAAFDFFSFALTDYRHTFVENFWSMFDWDNFPPPNPLPGAVETLAALSKASISTAIATARLMSVTDLSAELALTGFMQHIKCISTRPDKTKDWTDKNFQIAEICNKLQINPAEAALIGDIPADITSAKNSGIGLTVAVLSGGLRKDVLENSKPDIIIPDVASLCSILDI